jgi:hypothetical protein
MERHRSDFVAKDQSGTSILPDRDHQPATVLAAVNDKPFGRPKSGPLF